MLKEPLALRYFLERKPPSYNKVKQKDKGLRNAIASLKITAGFIAGSYVYLTRLVSAFKIKKKGD